MLKKKVSLGKNLQRGRSRRSDGARQKTWALRVSTARETFIAGDFCPPTLPERRVTPY